MATMLSVTARRLISRSVGRPTFTANLVHKNAPKAYAIDFQYQRWMSSNPPHEVVGMPSLSPVRSIKINVFYIRPFYSEVEMCI